MTSDIEIDEYVLTERCRAVALRALAPLAPPQIRDLRDYLIEAVDNASQRAAKVSDDHLDDLIDSGFWDLMIQCEDALI